MVYHALVSGTFGAIISYLSQMLSDNKFNPCKEHYCILIKFSVVFLFKFLADLIRLHFQLKSMEKNPIGLVQSVIFISTISMSVN